VGTLMGFTDQTEGSVACLKQFLARRKLLD
jgi:hypothetical protein